MRFPPLPAQAQYQRGLEGLNMSEELYNLEFSGQIIPGWDIDEVKDNLAKLLKANEEKILNLFSGNRFLIKKNVDHQTVIKINNVLKDAGADCTISQAADSSAKTPPPLPSQSDLGQTVQMPSTAADPELAAAAAPELAPVAKAELAPADIRPTKFWYIVAILLFAVPMIVGAIRMAGAVNSIFSGGTQLMVPGETDLQINKPGTYIIYYETSLFTLPNMVHNQLGQTFGMAFMDLATGEELALKAPEFPISHEYGTTALQGIAQVQFDTLGAYSATVAGQIPGGDKLMVRRFDMVELIKGLVWGFVLIFLGFIAGPVMALVVLVKRQNYKRLHRNEPIGEKEERQWAMFAHLGTFSSMFVPLGNFIAPIVIWQIKKHESDFVVEQAKESLNFQITLILYFIISIPLCFIIIGFFLIFALVIFGLIMVIVGGIRANEGEDFCYPMTL
ncbi:MAG: DUF4870 domain-containing protein, partial [Desulfobacterales bacterium]|nr:DUF4870 domain-containing protein [Desulfobacterales bacterium]